MPDNLTNKIRQQSKINKKHYFEQFWQQNILRLERVAPDSMDELKKVVEEFWNKSWSKSRQNIINKDY